jgi:hypothetical protein
MPYMQRWQFGVQRELPGGYLFEVSYVGNRGTAIEIGQNLNVTPQRYLSRSPERDNTTRAYLSANLSPNPFQNLLPVGASGTFTSSNIARERLLRPYPHFENVSHSRFDGYSWYHSLQIQAQKRFSRGYTVQGNYTYSKFMQATELLNQDDARPYEVLSDLDRPHRFTMSAIYELPFGRGRRFGANAPTAASILISGWQIAGLYAFQSGSPLGWGNVIFRGDIRNIAIASGQQSVNRWFNTDAGFEKASANQLDRNVRTFPLRFGFIRADTINNYDFSIAKNTRVAEGKDIQFKLEFLNAFNHPLFAAPNTDPTSANFGRIVTSNQANYARRIQMSLKFLW